MLLSNQPVPEWLFERLPHIPPAPSISSVNPVCLTWAERGHIPHPKALSGTVETVGSRNQGVIASLSRLLSRRQTGQAGQCCGCSPSAIPGRLRMLGTHLVPTFNLSSSCFLLYSLALQMATRPGQDLGR